MKDFKEILQYIEENGDLYGDAVKEAEVRQDQLAKPTGALGDLEGITIKLAGITGRVKNDVTRQAITVFSSDNGVVEEGVASAPQSVTYSQTINFTRRYTGVSSMAKYFGIDILVTDCGVKMDIPDTFKTESMTEETKNEDGSVTRSVPLRIVDRRLAKGTDNLAKGEAMDRDTAIKAVSIGLEAADAVSECGYQIFGIGEMGIGNTTTSACVLGALTEKTAAEIVGRGGGLNDAGLKKKVEIVDKAISGCDHSDPIDILSKCGGFDICAMTGAYLGAAYHRIPVVIDGYISAVAALCAARLAPKAKNFMFASHQSTEPGYLVAMKELGIKPMFNLGMRLGEGSGCPISFKIIEAATATMNGMATFSEGAIDADYLEERKEGNFF